MFSPFHKITVVVLFIFFTGVEVMAGTSPQLIPYRKNDKWGYSTKNKKIIIEPVYDEAGFFDDHVAWVRKDNRWALISDKGKTLTEFKYRLANNLLNTDFCVNGLILVIVNNKFGFIDTKGVEVIPCVYDRATTFEKGSARVKSAETWALINTKGKEITSKKFDEIYEFKEDIAIVRIGEKMGYIDRAGNEITPLMYDTRTFEITDCKGEFHNGYARVCKNDSCGFINKNGDVVIPLQFKYCVDFVTNYFVAHNFDDTRTLYNRKAKQVFKKSYYNVTVHEYGFTADEWTDKGLFKKEYTFKGQLIKINTLPDSVEYMRLNKFLFGFCSDDRGETGIVTRTGKILFPENYFQMLRRNVGRKNNGMVEFSKSYNHNTSIGFLSKKGKICIPAMYISASDFVGDNVILIDQKWKYLVMDKRGKEIISPKYKEIIRVSNKYYYAGVMYEVENSHNPITKYGYMSPKGVEYWEDTRTVFK